MMQDSTQSKDEARWNALRSGAGDLSQTLIYAVRSTGIYCRVGCRSRRPRWENVRFFESPAAARRAGYRPCKRCDPDRPAPQAPLTEAIIRACRAMEAITPTPALAELAADAGVSMFHFQRTFRRIVGVTPKQYAMRLAASKGRSRSANRRAETGVIRWARTDTALGSVLLAATEKGLCAVEFLDEAAAPARASELFPHARLLEDQQGLAGLADAVRAMVDAPGAPSVNLPLDIAGTAFQERVWRALREIPLGETRTYHQIAEQLGSPLASRAVGQACGRNRLALVVPCHRVTRRGGELGGYRWDPKRKAALLERERTAKKQRLQRRREGSVTAAHGS